MKEATLFILKQVLDEFGTTDKVMEIESARVFLDQIRGLMQDGGSKSFLLSPPLSPFVIVRSPSEASSPITTSLG